HALKVNAHGWGPAWGPRTATAGLLAAAALFVLVGFTWLRWSHSRAGETSAPSLVVNPHPPRNTPGPRHTTSKLAVKPAGSAGVPARFGPTGARGDARAPREGTRPGATSHGPPQLPSVQHAAPDTPPHTASVDDMR